MIFLPNSRIKYLILFLTVCILASGCSPYKTLKENQYLLNSQEVKGADKLSTSAFTGIYKEHTNKKIFGYPYRIPLYNLGFSFFDSSKVHHKLDQTIQKYDAKMHADSAKGGKMARLQRQKERKVSKLQDKISHGNTLMKLGERPAIYDSTLIRQTQQLMHYQLLANGFFRGAATVEKDTSKRRINVKYLINEGPEFVIQQLYYHIEDTGIDSIVRAGLKSAALKEGTRYKEADLTAERERITKDLRNQGYFEFNSGYIYFNVDTTGADRTKIKLQTVIANPPNKSRHAVYRVDTVLFISNYMLLDSIRKYDTTIYNGVTYVSNRNFRFSKKTADRKVMIHPGDLYSQTSVEKTQQNLSTLDMFRTVSIRYQADTTSNRLKAVIQANTFRKHALTGEMGVSFTQAFVPGPFGSISYRERNIFGGFQLFELNARVAIAGQAAVLDPNSILRTEEYSLLGSLSFPELYFPGFRTKKWEDNNPRTRLTLGYTIVRRPEYERATGRAEWMYSIHLDKQRQILFSPIDINIINTASISDSFQHYLEHLHYLGNNLIYSFRKSYVSDMNISYNFSNHDPLQQKVKSRAIKHYFESGGTFLNLTNTEKILGLNTFRYLKLNTDLRYYFPVGRNTFAMRLNIGAAKPYGSNGVLPYEKYFFAGGPNSIRAWKLRRLGPGSYLQRDSATGASTYRIEQPGEMILESSMEYRFKMIGFFEGALFVDAGNVWMLTKDPARPGSEFRLNSFVSQIAVGTGFGLRLNLSFLIVRLDLGVKAYDPAVKRFVLTTTGFRQSILNFGIGYPF